MAMIEINGKELEVESGSMVIEAADNAGIYIPRFCYHKKLTIAANCRMCLVEVEKSPKPLPACATPVTDGMKVFTRSTKAVEAQKAVMEYLLINHPLDCPICDQGGECELQDLSMGYGRDRSFYTEPKRSVHDEDLGPLIATEMTRCIHCTRCVRFGQEIAGLRELGATDRGEAMQIGTYVKKSLVSELSGNIIDLCPVGALTSKPFRFKARAWELIQKSSIAPHDCVGSHVYIHSRRGKVLRVVPKMQERINEMWLSDRDRFSYLGLYTEDRLKAPMIKRNGQWQAVDWDTALKYSAEKLQHIVEQQGSNQEGSSQIYASLMDFRRDAKQGRWQECTQKYMTTATEFCNKAENPLAKRIGAWVSPASTTEEHYLLQKILRHCLGSHHIDHRLHQTDFSDQNQAPLFPHFAPGIQALEIQNTILLIGSHINREQPLLAARIRKATLNDAQVLVINPIDYRYHFPLVGKAILNPLQIPRFLAGIVKALMDMKIEPKTAVPDSIIDAIHSVIPTEIERDFAQRLNQGEQKAILLGALALNHPNASTLRTLAHVIAQITGASMGYLTAGPNSAGAWLAGAVPHRLPAGYLPEYPGLPITDMLNQALKAYILYNIEPDFDCANPRYVKQILRDTEFVLAFTPYQSENLLENAHVLLPIAPFSENSGTFVNVEGRWQSFTAAIAPLGETREGWRVLHDLGNHLNPGYLAYTNPTDICTELQSLVESQINFRSDLDLDLVWKGPLRLSATSDGSTSDGSKNNELTRIGEWSLYTGDNLVRRSQELQASASNEPIGVYLNPKTAARLNLDLENEKLVRVKQADTAIHLPLILDERVPFNCAWVACGWLETSELGECFGSIEVTKR